jgi:uncharacterized protein GlcG (DUF336 family)
MLPLALAGLGEPMIRTLAFVSVGLLASIPVFAQGAPAPKGIPLDLAMEAAKTAVDTCKANGYNAVAVVLNSEAIPIITLQDGTRPNTMDGARRKAYTALKSHMTSMAFGKSIGFKSTRLKPGDPPTQFGVIDGDPSLIPFGGGVPIKVGGQVVAAIAASGAPGPDKDEACAQAGLSKIADRLH